MNTFKKFTIIISCHFIFSTIFSMDNAIIKSSNSKEKREKLQKHIDSQTKYNYLSKICSPDTAKYLSGTDKSKLTNNEINEGITTLNDRIERNQTKISETNKYSLKIKNLIKGVCAFGIPIAISYYYLENHESIKDNINNQFTTDCFDQIARFYSESPYQLSNLIVPEKFTDIWTLAGTSLDLLTNFTHFQIFSYDSIYNLAFNSYVLILPVNSALNYLKKAWAYNKLNEKIKKDEAILEKLYNLRDDLV